MGPMKGRTRRERAWRRSAGLLERPERQRVGGGGVTAWGAAGPRGLRPEPGAVGLPPGGVQRVTKALPLPHGRPPSAGAAPAASGSVSAPGAARSARTRPGTTPRGRIASAHRGRLFGAPQGAAVRARPDARVTLREMR